MLKLSDLTKIGILKLVHKFLYSDTNEVFSSYFIFRQSMHDRNIRDHYDLHIPRTKKRIACTSVKVFGCQLWNNIDISLRKQRDPALFKHGLFDSYINNYV